MTHEQIKFFLEVARCGSLTYAAEHLYISLPSLSKNIKALEDEIGVPLFVRKNRGVDLTPEGKVLFDSVERPFSIFSSTYDRVTVGLRTRGKTISVGVSADELVNPDLLTICSDMNRKHQGEAQFVIRATPSDRLCTDLSSGELDAIIINEVSVRNMIQVSYHQLAKAGIVLAVNRDHPLADAESVSPKDFRNDRFIVVTPRNSDSIVDMVTRMDEFSPNCIYVDNIQSALLSVAAGAGVAIVPESAENYGRDMVRRIPVKPQKGDSIHYCIAWMENRRSPLQQELIQRIIRMHEAGDH